MSEAKSLLLQFAESAWQGDTVVIGKDGNTIRIASYRYISDALVWTTEWGDSDVCEF
jgi:hypothetical protein